MFSVEEEYQIERVNKKYDEISSAIEKLSSSLSELEQTSITKQKYIESNFDQLIFKLKNRKITLLDELNKISSIKKKLLFKQLQQMESHKKELNEFKAKYDQIVLGESHGMNPKERKNFILSTTKQLLTTHFDCHPIVNPLVKIESMDTTNAFEMIQHLGSINPCNIPYPPKVCVKEIYASSAKIAFEDDIKCDTPKSTEYKIEILRQNDLKKQSKNQKDDDEKEKIDKWETAMIVDDGEKECMLRGLVPSTCYLVRVCGWNKNGWSCYSKTVEIKTFGLSRVGKRLIYLCPTAYFQNKLSLFMTSYFTRWKGFHITIGGRHVAGTKNLSSAELIQELSELGAKKSNKKLWKIPNGKWKVLGGKDLIVLGLDDDISIFKVSSKFLQSKGWTNVKHKSYHITLGLKQDLNREQIKQMAHILVDKDEPVEWEWVSVTERPDGKIVWDQRFPAYHL